MLCVAVSSGGSLIDQIPLIGPVQEEAGFRRKLPFRVGLELVDDLLQILGLAGIVQEDVVPLKLTEEMGELEIALISRRDVPANRWEIAFRNALTASFRED